jgi:hypothetical protein
MNNEHYKRMLLVMIATISVCVEDMIGKTDSEPLNRISLTLLDCAERLDALLEFNLYKDLITGECSNPFRETAGTEAMEDISSQILKCVEHLIVLNLDLNQDTPADKHVLLLNREKSDALDTMKQILKDLKASRERGIH